MATFRIDGRQYGSEDVRRFVAKVVVGTDGCWRWVGSLGPYRYGTYSRYEAGQLVQVSVRRFAWAANHGNIQRGQLVRTTCGVDGCVNPDHLVLVEDGVDSAAGAGDEDQLVARVEEQDVIVAGLVGGTK